MDDDKDLKVCDEVLNASCIDHKVSIKIDAITDGDIAFRDDGVEGKQYYWKGTLIYDKILNAFDGSIKAQYDNGRITGDQYASILSNMTITAMQQAIDIEYKNQELDLKAMDLCLKRDLEKNLNALKKENILSNTRLLERQLEGFNDNIMIKLLQAQLDSFSMIFSSGMLDDGTLPDPLNKTELADVYESVKELAKKTSTYKVETRIPEPRSTIIL